MKMKKLIITLLILLLSTFLWGQTDIKINSGGSAVAGGWESDDNYVSGGSSYNFGGTHDTSAVTNPAPNDVYQRVQHRDHTYNIPVANGDYLVRIHFTEGYEDPTGKRKMKYTIEGLVVLNNFNIYSEAGNSIYKVVIKEFNTTVNDGVLTINCEQDSGNDVFEAGIEVIGGGSFDYEMSVKTIQFNHDTNSNSGDALNIRFDWYTNIPLPEYNYDLMNSAPAAYAVDDMNQPVTIKVQFDLNTMSSVTLPVRGISSDSFDGVLGNTNTVNVSFSGGYSGITDFSVPFEISRQVYKGEDYWIWQAYVNGAWTDMDETNHDIYLLLDKPKNPWKEEYGNKQNPWTSALDFAIEFFYCDTIGSTTPELAAYMITWYLFNNYVYDTDKGSSGYLTDLGHSVLEDTPYVFHNNLDLNRYMYNPVKLVNCTDQAAALESIAAVLGIDAKAVRTRLSFGYINTIDIAGVGPCNNPFFNDSGYTNQPIVNSDFIDSDGRSYFGFHAFVQINNKIYDATAGPNLGEYDLMTYISNTVDSSTQPEANKALSCTHNYPAGINIGFLKILFINCGGPNVATNANWSGMDIWKAGNTFSSGGISVSFDWDHYIDPSLENPAGQEVYQTAQRGNHQYNLTDIPDGKYNVRLHFSDAEESAQYKRMRFKINNVIKLDNFCIFDEAGGQGFSSAVIKEFQIDVLDGNGIIIECEDLAGVGVLINGIEIISITPGLIQGSSTMVYYDQTVSLAPDSELYRLRPLQKDNGFISPYDNGDDDPDLFIMLSECSNPIPLIADPEDGYRFVRWEWSGPVTIEDPNSAVTYLTLSNNATIWAVFTPDTGTLGDVNLDGRTNIADALLIAQYYVGLNPPGFTAPISAGDTDCNGSVNIIDALLVAKKYVGLPTPAWCR